MLLPIKVGYVLPSKILANLEGLGGRF